MILGSGFSPAFAEVIFLIDAVIIALVLLALFHDRIAAAWAAMLHRASTMVACLIAHIGVRLR